MAKNRFEAGKSSPVTYLSGIGEKKALLFNKLLLVNGSGLLAVLAVLTGTELTTVQNLLGFRGDCKPERAGNLGFGSTIGHCYLERKLFS